jgi:hypothetical protein
MTLQLIGRILRCAGKWLNHAMGPEGFEPPTLSFEGSCSIH